MLAFIPVMFPLIPVLLGSGAGAATAAAFRSGGRKKAKIAEIKARTEAWRGTPDSLAAGLTPAASPGASRAGPN